MVRSMLGKLDRSLRSLAYRVLSARDGVSGWRSARNKFLEDMQKTPDQLNADIETKLSSLLLHANNNSPYYRRLWRENGHDPAKDRFPSALQNYPFMTKDIIRDMSSELVVTNLPRSTLDADFTSGTTRARTTFYRDHACTVSRVGRQWGVLQCCNYRPGMRRALIWGVSSDLPAAGEKKNLKEWFREYAASQEALGCKVMGRGDMLNFHARLTKFRPAVLYGYPSAMTQFANYIDEMNLSPIQVKTIFTTAERLTPRQRSRLHEAFSGEVYNLYCTREYGCIGFECEQHNGLHIDTESVYVEIIKDGKIVPNGEGGEITITDLLNYGMPIIRSRTGDIGTLSELPCECGSAFPLLKSLDGRVFDNIYRPDGSIVAGVLLSYLFLDIPAIRATQYVQESVQNLTVYLEVTDEFNADMEANAARQLKERMGEDLTITMHRVKEIPRNPLSGKYQEVICKIPDEERDLFRKEGATNG